MAPFWNDYDPRAKGDIWYYNTTDNYDLLINVSTYVNIKTGAIAGNLDDLFVGEWALIATWENVPHYPHYWVTRYPQYYSSSYREQLEREVRKNTARSNSLKKS